MIHVYIGIGSNIDRDTNIRKGVVAIREKFGKVNFSNVYESKAYGFEGDNFFNLVAGFNTRMTVDELTESLRETEYEFDRRRQSKRFLSRTMDIDLLLYGDLVRHDDVYDLPREDILCYSFVLCPLAEIAGNEIHPELDKCFKDIWKEFDKNNQPLWPANINIPAN